MSSDSPTAAAALSRRTRIAVAMLRVPSRVSPVPGWFPLVVERAHRALALQDAQVVYETGGVRMALDLSDYVQRRIFYSAFERDELAALRRLLRPGDVVIDVGANVGFITLTAARAVGPGGAVHAFEPIPANFEALERNVALSGFRNVRANRVAVGDTEGTMTLGLVGFADAVGSRGRSGTSGNYSQGETHRQVTAPVVTLDAYLAEHLTDRPIRLVKIDVEGVEPRVIAGLAQRLRERPPDAFLVEINHRTLKEHGHDASQILEPLLAAGYELFRVSAFGRLRPLAAGAPSRIGLVNVVALQPSGPH